MGMKWDHEQCKISKNCKDVLANKSINLQVRKCQSLNQLSRLIGPLGQLTFTL